MIKKILLVAVLAACTLVSAGCEKAENSEMVSVDIWHVYGAQTESPMNDMIDLFNKTVGKEKNIEVNVTSVTNNNTIHQNVIASAYDDPGAAELPDMFVSYPKTVSALPDDEILVDYNDYFSEEELGEYVEEFLDEGKINGRQLILPVAKSAEIMFINQNVFDRFSEDTGVTADDLRTWEGLYRAAVKYYEWTDGFTPDIPYDGKAMVAFDDPFNYFQVGTKSLGADFFDENGNIVFGPEFRRVWSGHAKAAAEGGIWLEKGYATEPFQTGDAIVSIGSSASVLYFPETVTYSDNTTEELKLSSMPVPVFENGENLVIQRGAGICTVKSTKEKEEACMTFLKWITENNNNTELVTALGYMPVKTKAFRENLPEKLENLENERYRALYDSYVEMAETYNFYVPSKQKNYLELETKFTENIRLLLAKERDSRKGKGPVTKKDTDEIMNRFVKLLEK